jgi:hypothetical protein
MNISIVVAIAAAAILQTHPAPERLDRRTDADSYAVILRDASPELVLQQEAEGRRIDHFRVLRGLSGEWGECGLVATAAVGTAYRLISRAEITAAGAELARKSPERGNAPRLGAIRYVALSLVGSTAPGTKRSCTSGGGPPMSSLAVSIRSYEPAAGWIRDPHGTACIGGS